MYNTAIDMVVYTTNRPKKKGTSHILSKIGTTITNGMGRIELTRGRGQPRKYR